MVACHAKNNDKTPLDTKPHETFETPKKEKKKEKNEKTNEIPIEIIEDESIAVLVNKQYALSEAYVPKDLIKLEVPTVLENEEVNQLRKEAADALKKMFSA